jgi:hypothetical protein
LAYFESCATIVLSRGVEMNYDHDKVDEMVLALLYLTISEQHEWGARAWKSHDWDALDRLHTKGYISDPKSKAKSVVLNAEGVLKLSGNLVQYVPTHRILLPVRIEKTDYSFRLLKRLNQTVQQQPVEAPVAEPDAIFMMFVKGVHGTLLRGQIPGA